METPNLERLVNSGFIKQLSLNNTTNEYNG